jgi:hypothetical protein
MGRDQMLKVCTKQHQFRPGFSTRFADIGKEVGNLFLLSFCFTPWLIISPRLRQVNGRNYSIALQIVVVSVAYGIDEDG